MTIQVETKTVSGVTAHIITGGDLAALKAEARRIAEAAPADAFMGATAMRRDGERFMEVWLRADKEAVA